MIDRFHYTIWLAALVWLFRPMAGPAMAQVDPLGLRSLTRTVDYEPFWSADGRRIALISNRTGAFNVYTMDADGRNVQRITAGPGPDDTPSWSTDGKTIAFVSEQDGNAEI